VRLWRHWPCPELRLIAHDVLVAALSQRARYGFELQAVEAAADLSPRSVCSSQDFLAALADPSDLELIRARTAERRARAKARGVKLGRHPKLTQ
jgi:hypothetical protein